MYHCKVISLVNIKNTAFEDIRFHCFKDGASVAWVSNQTKKTFLLLSQTSHLTKRNHSQNSVCNEIKMNVLYCQEKKE